MLNKDFDLNNTIDLSDKEHLIKITALKKLVRSLELRYMGYEWNSKGDKFRPTGNVLLGKELIQKAVGLLQPFCEDINLITNKEARTLSKQKFHTDLTFLTICLNDGSCPEHNYRVVFSMFKNTLQNMSDVIIKSLDFVRSVYAPYGINEDKKEKDVGVL